MLSAVSEASEPSTPDHPAVCRTTGTPYAISARLAHPDRPVIAFVGAVDEAIRLFRNWSAAAGLTGAGGWGRVAAKGRAPRS